jgi:acyl carrier protein
MANFQIPLNGSNFINKDRQRAFQEALDDQHQIDCQDQEQSKVSETEVSSSGPDDVHIKDYIEPHTTAAASGLSSTTTSHSGLDQALDHTFTHQARTMEIHQQYLAQQAENIQLITAVLTQQGKVLDSNNSTPQAKIIETFQRTLDNFHTIREQSLSVHQEFLTQQAEFSERYLSFLENNERPVFKSTPEADKQSTPPAEWVVHVPPIVLDEKAAPEGKTLKDNPPAEQVREVYLQDHSSAPSITSEELSKALINIVAEKTGYPPEMLELNMDLEADLGIDSIKRVEILGALEDDFPSLPPADTEVLGQTRTLQEIVDYMDSENSSPTSSIEMSVGNSDPQLLSSETLIIEETKTSAPPATSSGATLSVEDLTVILLEIVAEKTGYPVEMLESDMDMEADLGIDSIKRVEILGVMEERVPGLPAVEAEALAELRTLGQIADLMSASQSTAEDRLPVKQEEKKKVNSVELQNTTVQLISLASPDRLDFLIPIDRLMIVTNDGTPFTGQVVNELIADGWKVSVWDFPTSLVSIEKGQLPKGIHRITQKSAGKEAISAALEVFRTEFGQPAGFIHLHPISKGEGLFSDQESELVKQVFLIAGSLKTDLEQTDSGSRNVFMTVTRTDGTLGLNNIESFQEGSGLTGLVKSLNWEWPEVFCRAIDLSNNIDPEHGGRLVLQEIHDPDLGLLEVGLSASARVTLQRENK